MNKQLTKSDWTNFLEVRVYGLMRSGNHAIIEWVQNQHSDHITCFLNNIKHGNKDPYTNHKRKVLTGIDESTNIEILRRMRKRLLVYSYEDQEELESNKMTFLDSVYQPSFEKNRQYYLGFSEHQLDMLIIRDPFNFLASRLKMIRERSSHEGIRKRSLIVKNWKILAKEAIRINQNPPSGKIVANYNRWVTDISYRKNLSKKIKGKFNDTSMNKISRFGGGSSFRDQDPEKLTISMIIARWKKLFTISRYAKFSHYWRRFTAPKIEERVFERWKHFAEDVDFLELILDKEILELSDELFGEIPGVRDFITTKHRK